jgi:hypothetical protein
VTPAAPGPPRTPARSKARQLAKYLRGERPDYAYLKEVFRHLRDELGVEVTRAPKKLPYVPTEAEISAFYDAVWKARRAGDVVLVKTLLYTGVRVSFTLTARSGICPKRGIASARSLPDREESGYGRPGHLRLNRHRPRRCWHGGRRGRADGIPGWGV